MSIIAAISDFGLRWRCGRCALWDHQPAPIKAIRARDDIRFFWIFFLNFIGIRVFVINKNLFFEKILCIELWESVKKLWIFSRISFGVYSKMKLKCI